jgi:serine/threonine protein kinase
VIGSGGYASVYKALDLTYNVERAIKEVTDPEKGAREQFRLEADLLINHNHPNIPRGFKVFDVGKRIYFVMDYVGGKDVEELLNESLTQQRRPLDEAHVLRWAIEICSALSFIHRLPTPIIHRDIKPANIKITPEDRPILIDFGLAKLQQESMKATRAAAQGVSPGFAPPEQYMAKGKTDARTDVYGLGATLYACLTGRDPAEAPARLLDQTGVSHGATLVSPRTLNNRISPRTEAVIVKALELSPSRRQQSAAELEAELRDAFNQLTGSTAAGSTLTMPQGAIQRPQVAPVQQQAPLKQAGGKGKAVKPAAPPLAPTPIAAAKKPMVAATVQQPQRPVPQPLSNTGRQPAIPAAQAAQVAAMNRAGSALSPETGQHRTLGSMLAQQAAGRNSSKHPVAAAAQPNVGMSTSEHPVLRLHTPDVPGVAVGTATAGALAIAEKERSGKMPRVSAKGPAVAASAKPAAPVIDKRSWVHPGTVPVSSFGKWLLAFSAIEALWGAVSITLGIISMVNHGFSMALLQRLGIGWLVVVVALSLFGGQAISRPVYRRGAIGRVRRSMQGMGLFIYTVVVHAVAIWGATIFISSPGNTLLAVIAYTVFGVNVLAAGVLSVYNILD